MFSGAFTPEQEERIRQLIREERRAELLEDYGLQLDRSKTSDKGVVMFPQQNG